MSIRARPDRASWLKTMKRIIGRRLRSGSLSTEAALQLCHGVLPSTRSHSPAPAFFTKANGLQLFIDKCYHSGDFGPEDALDLFDGLLPQAKRGSVCAFGQLLHTVARAPTTSSVGDGPAFAVSLFNRMARAGAKVVAPNTYTYGILIGSCCRLGRLDLAFAALGQIIKTGCMVDVIVFNQLLNGLCSENRTNDAIDIVLTRMTELGCTPSMVSVNILLKGLCKENRCQEAVELLHKIAEDGDNDQPNVVSYITVIHGFIKEGEVGKACSLFREMLDHGTSPDVVTCSSIVHGLCKVQAMDKAKEVLQQMLAKGIIPDNTTYNYLLHGYCSLGQWEEVVGILKEMSSVGQEPDISTCNILIDLRRDRKKKEWKAWRS